MQMVDYSAYKFYHGEESNPFRRGTLRHGIWEWEKRCEEVFQSDEDPSFAWWNYCKEELKDEKLFWDKLSQYFDEENMVRFCADKKGVVRWFMNRHYPKEAIPYLKQTRLYKGEPPGVNPYDKEDNELGVLFFYESCWVRFHFNDASDYVKMVENEFVNDVGADFEANDGVPLSLKGIFYNRYMHWSYGPVECFKEWYRNSVYHRKNYIKWKKYAKKSVE